MAKSYVMFIIIVLYTNLFNAELAVSMQYQEADAV